MLLQTFYTYGVMTVLCRLGRVFGVVCCSIDIKVKAVAAATAFTFEMC